MQETPNLNKNDNNIKLEKNLFIKSKNGLFTKQYQIKKGNFKIIF